jgi:hypothetical protein
MDNRTIQLQLLIGNIPDAKLQTILEIIYPHKPESYDANNRYLRAISYAMSIWPPEKCNMFLVNLNIEMLNNSVPISHPVFLTIFKLALSLPKPSVKLLFDILGREKIQNIFDKKNYFSQFKEILKSSDPNILVYLLAKIDKKNIQWNFKRLSTALYILRRIENNTNVNADQKQELIQAVLQAIKSLPIFFTQANEVEAQKELSIIIGRLSRLSKPVRDLIIDTKFPDDVLIRMIDMMSSLKSINGILAFLPANRHQPLLDSIPYQILDKCIASDLLTNFPNKVADLNPILVEKLYEYTSKGGILGVSANNSEMQSRILSLYPYTPIEHEVLKLVKMAKEFQQIATKQQEHVQKEAKSDSLEISRNKLNKANIMLKVNLAIQDFIEKPELGTHCLEKMVATLMVLRHESASNPHVGIKNTLFGTPSTTTQLIDDFIDKAEKYVDTDVLNVKLAELSSENNPRASKKG